MAKKRNEISITKWESTIKPEAFVVPLVDKDNQEVAEITIKPVLSFSEMYLMIHQVVSVCVDEDNGTYRPEMIDFVLRREVMTKYANFRMPEDPEKAYDLIYRTDAFWIVLDNIDINQYNEIKKAIHQRIDHKIRLIENTLASQIRDIANKISLIVSDSAQSFSTENSTDLIEAFIGGKIDEEKLVKSVFDNQKERESTDSETANNVIEMIKK